MRILPRGKREWRNAGIRLGLVLLIILVVPAAAGFWFAHMPGESYRRELPALSGQQAELAAALRSHVEMLAGTIGVRPLHRPDNIARTVAYVERAWNEMGLQVERQAYELDGQTALNLEVELPGTERASEIVVVGAHYDTVGFSPGADDNASGVAALLELTRRVKDLPRQRTVRFVAFTAEEPPYFRTDGMGSVHYAARCRERNESVFAMVCLEMLGCYVHSAGEQRYPPLLGLAYPEVGDFIGFVGNFSSGWLVKRAIGVFRERTSFPSEGLMGPSFIPGVDFSDHRSFWGLDYPAIMVTDTAFFRNRNYHSASDLPATLDYDRMARVVEGMVEVVADLGSR